jgi:hypothetical protein
VTAAVATAAPRSLRRVMSGVAPVSLGVQVVSFASAVTLAHVLGATV